MKTHYFKLFIQTDPKSRIFLFIFIFMCFCPSGSSWIDLKMALVSVLSEILQRPTIVWCVKQVDDVHSASLGSGSCQGFGSVGMEAQMGQCFVQRYYSNFTNCHNTIHMFCICSNSKLEFFEVSVPQLHSLDLMMNDDDDNYW